jgi:transglutaminase-like putative cysteine protease
MEGVVWTNRAGDALKTRSEAMGMETYRVSEAEALAKSDAPGVDLLGKTSVPVTLPIPNAHRSNRVRYRVRLEGGDPSSVFVTGATQKVESIDPHTAEVTVYAIRAGKPGGNPQEPADSPTDADRRPTSMIQSDDPQVVAEAKEAAAGENDPWPVAAALERYVHRIIAKKDYSQTFATAAEVAKSHEGDCTEHAVFLAALARARGIPARVAIGLVYVEAAHAFGFHMWTAVWIADRWIPLDGTLALGGIGAAHLKIAQSSLDGTGAFSAFLPVAQVVGRLRIEVVDAE